MSEVGHTGKVDEESTQGPSSEVPSNLISPAGERNLWEALFPLFAFIVVNRLFSLLWAIVVATLWSLKITFQRYRNGYPIGRFLPIVTIGIIARGVVGIITDSEAVYFGIGIGIKASVGVALIVSALLRKNLLAVYAPLLLGFQEEITSQLAYRKAMNHIAVFIACAQFASSAFDIWLFNNASVDGYLLIRFFVNWPFTTMVIVVSFFYLNRRLSEIDGFPGIANLMEEKLGSKESEKQRKQKKKET